jgi:hypothetical protein
MLVTRIVDAGETVRMVASENRKAHHPVLQSTRHSLGDLTNKLTQLNGMEKLSKSIGKVPRSKGCANPPLLIVKASGPGAVVEKSLKSKDDDGAMKSTCSSIVFATS